MDDNHWIYVTKDLNTATKTRDGRNMRKAIFEAVTGERAQGCAAGELWCP